MRINILSPDVVDRIAAGEVVQRPASAVKELIENSIDAGASRIEVNFQAGGRTVSVSDDGSGMEAEELELAVKRHATSKIKDSRDLEWIETMGFRGEALPSVASVSRLTITTKTAGSGAVRLKISGGKKQSAEAAARGKGTTVVVKDLFYNTPARRKFLKTEATEKKHIIKTTESLALSRPEISFALREKSRTLFDLPPSDLKERFVEIAGGKLSGNLLPVDFENPYIKLSGWAGSGEVYFSNKNRIYVFVNSRPVVSPVVLHALARGYRQFIPPKKHPACALRIEIDPSMVDVNVHPAKREVKFLNQQGVHQIVSKVLRTVLEKSSGVFKARPEREEKPPETPLSGAGKSHTRTRRPGSRPGRSESSMDKLRDIDLSEVRKFSFSPPSLSDSRRKPSGEGKIRPAFQFKNKYIVAEDEEGIVLIDQHTAWERINYETLKEQEEREKPPVQGLLIPEVVEFERSRAHLISENLDILKQHGLMVEEFGPAAFKITAVPASLGRTASGEEAHEMLEEITELIEKSGKSPSRQELHEEIIKLIACRSSVMAGDSLNEEEIEQMCRRLSSCRIPHRCPHGRPVMIRFGEKDIDKRFSR